MIINSSEGTDLLPMSYMNNDFDGLFESEERVGRSSLFKTPSPHKSSPSKHHQHQYSLEEQQERQLQQKHLQHNYQQSLDLMRRCQKAVEMKKKRSLLIQKHLNKALLCLQQANTSDRFKSSTYMQNPLLISNLHSKPLQLSRGCTVNTYIPGICTMGSHNPTVADHDSIRLTPKEGDTVTTPLLSKLFPHTKDSAGISTQNDLIASSSSSSEGVSPDKESLTPIPSDSYSRNKKRPHSDDSVHNCRVNKSQKTSSSSSSSHRYVKVVASKLPRKQQINELDLGNSPFSTYLNILHSRSYDTKKFKSLSRYVSTPSELQKASFGNAVIKTVHERDCKQLQNLLSCGLSPNPSNQFGDSILNTICKRGHLDLFQTLLDCGASILTSDHFGRTPLHFVCWSSNTSFVAVEKILSFDVNMLRATDKVGKTPLDYVSVDRWDEWNAFLRRNQDVFWPKDKQNCNSDVSINFDAKIVPILPDPKNALSEDVARLLSSGSISLSDLQRYQKKLEG